MTDLDLLWRAILSDPYDTTARLAYADALEEAGRFLKRARHCRAMVTKHPHQVKRYRLDVGFDRVTVFNWLGAAARVCIDQDAFLCLAPVLFEDYPIVAVSIENCLPVFLHNLDTGNRGFFHSVHYDPGPTRLSPRFAAAIRFSSRFHASSDEAQQYLSSLCVDYGRGLAGLPPLVGRPAPGLDILRRCAAHLPTPWPPTYPRQALRPPWHERSTPCASRESATPSES